MKKFRDCPILNITNVSYIVNIVFNDVIVDKISIFFIYIIFFQLFSTETGP